MSEVLLKTRLFTVEQRQYPLPGGEALERSVVVHPGAAVILPLMDDGSIVLIRNYRYTVERELLELPAGTLEPPEPPIEAAARELQEETGYRARVLEPMAEFFPSPGVMTERMYAFRATDLTHVGQNLQGNERITVEVQPAEQVRQWLIEGRFEDGKTIALLGLHFAREAAGSQPGTKGSLPS
jgi:ADP-ribose pyrophosphatase